MHTVLSAGFSDSAESPKWHMDGTSGFCVKIGNTFRVQLRAFCSIGEAHRGGCRPLRPFTHQHNLQKSAEAPGCLRCRDHCRTIRTHKTGPLSLRRMDQLKFPMMGHDLHIGNLCPRELKALCVSSLAQEWSQGCWFFSLSPYENRITVKT